MTTATNPYRQIPHPAGAVHIEDWDDADTPEPFRFFDGSRWGVDRPHRDSDLEVRVSGLQYHDGRIVRDIVVHELHADEPITIEQARRLAAALIAAADEVEQMNGYDQLGSETQR